jgi:hypothetical protein
MDHHTGCHRLVFLLHTNVVKSGIQSYLPGVSADAIIGPVSNRVTFTIRGGDGPGGAVGLCTLNQVDPYPIITYSLSNP